MGRLVRTYGITTLLAAFVMLVVALVHAPVAAAWNNTRSDGQAWAANFCATPGDNYFGLGDFMWPSATDGGTTIYATYGDTSVNVLVTVTGRYCPGYTSQRSGSNYSSNIGGISGSFVYGNNGANNTFDDSQIRPMNITGWGPGTYHVCMVLATWSINPTLTPVNSPSQCADLTLVIKYPWSTDGMSQVGVDHVPNVSSWPAQPGQTVTWNHGIWNTTPYGTNQITAAVERSGFSPASGLNGNQYPYWPGAQFTLGPWGNYWFGSNTGNYNNGNFAYRITQNDVGAGFNGRPSICQYASWGPWWYGYNWGDPWKATSPACVQVPYNFKLTPTVNAPADTVEPGVSIGPIDPNVNNTGPTKSYDGTQWQLSKFILGPGVSKPGKADSNGSPCAYYNNGCTNVGSGNQTFTPGDSTVGSLASYTVDDAKAGSRICFALSVTGYDAAHQPNSGWWRNGEPTCIMIGKKPKLQVWGGDVATRAGINVSLTQKTTGMYGSWVEYGAFSVGSNSGFASGAGLNPTPTPQTSTTQAGWSKLTFANVNVAGGQQFGNYVAPASNFRSVPNIAQYFGAISNKAAFVGNKPGAPENTFQTGSGVRVMTAGDLTLQGDMIPKNRSTVIVASGTVTITGDITYDSKGLASMADIPQLVIIAKNINITSGVNNVDAWLVTSDATAGVIDTCSDVASKDLTAKVCSNKLTIHGPVVAGELHLKRTGGSDTGAQSGDPAELIDLRPDAYLWGQLVAGGAGKAETVNTIELPPRF